MAVDDPRRDDDRRAGADPLAIDLVGAERLTRDERPRWIEPQGFLDHRPGLDQPGGEAGRGRRVADFPIRLGLDALAPRRIKRQKIEREGQGRRRCFVSGGEEGLDIGPDLVLVELVPALVRRARTHVAYNSGRPGTGRFTLVVRRDDRVGDALERADLRQRAQMARAWKP